MLSLQKWILYTCLDGQASYGSTDHKKKRKQTSQPLEYRSECSLSPNSNKRNKLFKTRRNTQKLDTKLFKNRRNKWRDTKLFKSWRHTWHDNQIIEDWRQYSNLHSHHYVKPKFHKVCTCLSSETKPAAIRYLYDNRCNYHNSHSIPHYKTQCISQHHLCDSSSAVQPRSLGHPFQRNKFFKI